MSAQSTAVATDLPTRLLATLETRKLSADGPYPLTIRELTSLAGPELSPEQVLKALGKQPLKNRVILGHTKSLDAPLALAEDATQLVQSDKLLEFALDQTCTSAKPTCAAKNLKAKVAKPLQAEFVATVDRRLNENRLPSTVGQRTKGKTTELYLRRLPPLEEALAAKLLRVLDSQRTLGSYPLLRTRLVELTDSKAKKSIIDEAFKHPLLQDKLLIVDLKKAGCLIAFQEDQDQVLKSAKLIEFLIHVNRKANEQSFALDDLGKGTPLKPLIVKALKTHIDTDTLPPTIGWMWVKKKQHLFLIADVHQNQQPGSQPAVRLTPSESQPPPAPPADFPRAFDEAFTRLDRHHGSHNFVHLKEIRNAMPYARDVFDSQLRQLRLAGRYTLSAAEGRHGLTPEEREAGIVEDGSLLLYVSRKSS